uniref:sulfatase-like hydrolase/transferase n=1 Tax=Algoriphagus sp. TaxID=1872435 RepID=UPI0025EC60E0
MKTLFFPYRLYIILLTACFVIACETKKEETEIGLEKKTNIIFILADDLGYGDLGFLGQQYIETPNIDRLAREGMFFSNFYS